MARQRKRRMLVKEVLPDYVRGSDFRDTSLLATSPATLKAHEARRGMPIIVPATVKIFGMRRLSVSELCELRVDTRYQRDEITNEVNELIVVLKKGGVIPDPISVVERKYGDHKSYIVDGQQRWWAHVDTSTPINAVIYHVHDFEEEVALFHALNIQSRVSAETRLRSIPGPSGDTLQRLNEKANSPLHSKIQFSYQSGHSQFSAMTLMRGLTALLSNTRGVGSVDRVTATFDRYYRMAPRQADVMVDAYATLIAQVFEKTKLRHVPAIAFGRICFAAFTDTPQRIELPNGKTMARLRTINWDAMLPTASIKWLPTVVDAIQTIWHIELVAEPK